MSNHARNRDTNHSCQDKLAELLAAGVLTNCSDQGVEKHPVQTEAELADSHYVKNEEQECFFQNKSIKDSYLPAVKLKNATHASPLLYLQQQNHILIKYHLQRLLLSVTCRMKLF